MFVLIEGIGRKERGGILEGYNFLYLNSNFVGEGYGKKGFTAIKYLNFVCNQISKNVVKFGKICYFSSSPFFSLLNKVLGSINPERQSYLVNLIIQVCSSPPENAPFFEQMNVSF